MSKSRAFVLLDKNISKKPANSIFGINVNRAGMLLGSVGKFDGEGRVEQEYWPTVSQPYDV
jgi:hypothetical protein